jgi:hypothetical protein
VDASGDKSPSAVTGPSTRIMKGKHQTNQDRRIWLFALLLLQHLSTLHGRRHNSTAARPHATGRSVLDEKSHAVINMPALNTALYNRYDQYVTPWKNLGVTHYMDVGSWGGLTFQVNMWLRFPCSADSSKREVRLVVVMSQAPARKYWWNWLEVVPKQLLVDGKLPRISFKSMHDRDSPPVNVTLAVWEDLIKQEVRTAALVGHATLHPGTFYRMEVEGVERVFQIPPKPCSAAAKTVFGGSSAWIGIGGRATKTNPPATYAFLVMEHVKHHMRLGFAGLAIVVQPHIAVGLLANDAFVRMVEQRHILLLTWVRARQAAAVLSKCADGRAVPNVCRMQASLYCLRHVRDLGGVPEGRQLSACCTGAGQLCRHTLFRSLPSSLPVCRFAGNTTPDCSHQEAQLAHISKTRLQSTRTGRVRLHATQPLP